VIFHSILGLQEDEELFLAEEFLGDLIALPVSMDVASSELPKDDAVAVRDKSGSILCLCVHIIEPAPAWLVLTDLYSSTKFAERLAGVLHARDVMADHQDVLQGIMQIASVALSQELLCDTCIETTGPLYLHDRIDSLTQFLKRLNFVGLMMQSNEVSGNPSSGICDVATSALSEPSGRRGVRILEIGCGSGMATQALVAAGFSPLAMDNDSCEVCSGLKSGHLPPERTFVLDARSLSSFFPERHFDAVVGFMVGMIDDVNWPIWREILLISASLSRNILLFTVYTEKEARRIEKALRSAGWDGQVIENRGDVAIYDQWAYFGMRAKAFDLLMGHQK
jgi:hypothetical protein